MEESFKSKILSIASLLLDKDEETFDELAQTMLGILQDYFELKLENHGKN